MEKQTIVALIATRSIPLADGLEALLKAIPQIDVVKIARTLEQAREQLETEKPTILLLDAGLLGSAPEKSLEKINSLSPKTQRVLLADDINEMKFLPNYAEAILVKGISPSATATFITNLLLAQGD